MANCEPLIMSVKGKLNSWSARSLSFAGRLLLINTVISGITNFWCATFSLPKHCNKLINSMCGAYLWKGTTEGHHSARVAWDQITLAKNEGGLGVRDLVHWNKAASIKLIWMLFFTSGSIWVAWFTDTILAGSISNFWTITENSNHSWLVKRLLRLRTIVYPWLCIEIGNGRTCRFWSDNWTPYGCLSDFLNLPLTSRLGIPRDATLASLNANGNWSLPAARSEKQVLIYAYLSTITLSDEEDQYRWEINGTRSLWFCTGDVYREIKFHGPVVDWSKTVWCSRGTPKHSFITWLFTLNRCPTRDRMLSWGLSTPATCLLCNSTAESRNHLFFECNYSSQVWIYAGTRSGMRTSPGWEQTLSDLRNLPGARHAKLLPLFVWQSTIYFLWSERNARLHRNNYRPPDSISHSIDCYIKYKIAAIRTSSPCLASSLFHLWHR